MLVKLMSVFDNLSTSQDGVLSLVFLWPLHGIYTTGSSATRPPLTEERFLHFGQSSRFRPLVACSGLSTNPLSHSQGSRLQVDFRTATSAVKE